MKQTKRWIALLLAVIMLIGSMPLRMEAATVKLNKSAATIYVGEQMTLTLTGTTPKLWGSRNKAVATVTNKGVVTAKKVGVATITCKGANGNTYTCKVTVKKRATLNAKKITLYVGGHYNLKLIGTTAKLWGSRNKAVASVDGKGKVTAKKAGAATITCKGADGRTYKCTVNVLNKKPEATEITCCVSRDEGRLLLNWTAKEVDGYELTIAKNNKFTSILRTLRYEGSKRKASLMNLPTETLYVRIRTYNIEDGEYVYSEWSKISSVKIHKHNYIEKVLTAPTCTEDGLSSFLCDCGRYHKNTVKAIGHSYVTITNTNTIYKKVKCKNCGDTYTILKEDAPIDKTYTIDLGNGKTATVVGHFEKKMAQEIFDMVNEYRVEQGLAKLSKASTVLQQAVDIRGYEIAHTFDHVRPNGEKALYSFNDTTGCCAENIAKGQKSATSVMNAWKNSPGHNANMLSKSSKSLAVSVFAEKQENGYLLHHVQLFAW